MEGLIRISELKGDYYIFDEENMEMVGETTNTRYKLGQKVTILVAGTDRMARTVDFALSENLPED